MVGLALRGRVVHPYWQRRFHSLGPRSAIYKPTVMGAHRIAIGEDVKIVEAMLSVLPMAWGRPDPAIRIGDRVGLALHCRILAAESVVIEDDVAIGAFSLVTDSDHKLDGPHENIALNPPQAAPVLIGRGSGLGERVAILAGSTIGRYCVIGTNSVVRGTIPDYSIATGIPARVVGRARAEGAGSTAPRIREEGR